MGDGDRLGNGGDWAARVIFSVVHSDGITIIFGIKKNTKWTIIQWFISPF